MKRNAGIFGSLVLALAGLVGCAGNPSGPASKKTQVVLDKIQGKAQVLEEPGSSMDSALNAGGSSVYIWEGMRRYRLFLRKPVDIVHGNEYVVEGIYAQKAIDEIGDPDQGKHGYPLQASCAEVVTKAWSGLAFDDIDAQASVLRTRVQRYPARAVFLVTKVEPVTSKDASAAAEPKKDDDKTPAVEVPAEKERALLVEGPTVQPAPLWDPEGKTVHCKVVIGTEGKISDLETGAQLCESVPWSQFRYQPTMQAGHPVKVSTEVEVRFEGRK